MHPLTFSFPTPIQPPSRPTILSCPRRARPPFRPLAPTMSSAEQDLRRRITTVKSAEKIVSAVRLVAAARIRKSSLAALQARPFADRLQELLSQLIAHISSRDIDVMAIAYSSPPLNQLSSATLADPIVQQALLQRLYLTLMKPTDPGYVSLVTVISADRRLCGGYNKGVISRAARRVTHLLSMGQPVELILVGNVAHAFFRAKFPTVPCRFFIPLGRNVDADHTSTTLSQILLSEFIAGDVTRVEIIYTRFISLLSTAPSVRTLLPLTPTGLESLGDEVFQLVLTTNNGRLVTQRAPRPEKKHSFYAEHVVDEYSISDEEAVLLLNSMLPMYITSQLSRIIRESIASEQASRLAAMSAASDNAKELAASLLSQYNRERQARITNEIIEVISNVTT